MGIKKNRRIIIGIILIIILSVGNNWSQKKSEMEAFKKVVEVDKASTNKEIMVKKTATKIAEIKETSSIETPWNLKLVNATHLIDAGYLPQLGEIVPDQYVDIRIISSLQDMLQAAEAEGMGLHICSSYRSAEKQKQVFNDTMGALIATGVSYLDAYNTTRLSVALPGTSEHELGLAVDIVSNDYIELDEKQATTIAAKWLETNCYKYGFILRYPPEKTKETGIIYEPWHYRYVGKDVAKALMQTGITLEEYLGKEE